MKLVLKHSYILLSFLFFVEDGISQSIGFVMPPRAKQVEIPFSNQNGFIVLDVWLQGFFPLKFIFDTGAETTIITNPRIAELLDLRYTRKFKVMGSDMESLLNAYLIKDVGIGLSIGGAPTQDVLVFDRDHFNLEEFVGPNVQGILGADVFKNYTVVIDYQAEKLIIYKPGDFSPNKKYVQIPMYLVKNKPYIKVDVAIDQQQTISSTLLVDTGAALSLLIDADEDKGLELPDKTIKGILGYGIGGELQGYLGRIASLDIADIGFDNLITNFRVFNPEIDSMQIRTMDIKDGLLGNEILKHFKTVLDYPNASLYLRPYRKNYKEEVLFDRSGLVLIMVGQRLQQIMVSNVFENSPASEAGFKKGDILKSINGLSTAFMTYEGILKRFKSQKNKRFKVKIIRLGKVLYLEFTLRDLI